MTYTVKPFGKLKNYRAFPKATRGGSTIAFASKKESPLQGQVQGLKAAKGEERLARGLDKRMGKGSVLGYYFRSSPGLTKGVSGWKELDFEVFSLHGTIAISVMGADFVHRGEAKRSQDTINELMLMQRLGNLGRPVKSIEHVFDYELKDQDSAEKVLKRLLGA